MNIKPKPRENDVEMNVIPIADISGFVKFLTKRIGLRRNVALKRGGVKGLGFTIKELYEIYKKDGREKLNTEKEV